MRSTGMLPINHFPTYPTSVIYYPVVGLMILNTYTRNSYTRGHWITATLVTSILSSLRTSRRSTHCLLYSRISDPFRSSRQPSSFPSTVFRWSWIRSEFGPRPSHASSPPYTADGGRSWRWSHYSCLDWDRRNRPSGSFPIPNHC